MSKKINLNESVSSIVKKYPEIREILFNLGFKDIINPIALNTIGKIVTIPKGAKNKGIDLEVIIEKLTEYGFDIENNTKGDDKEKQTNDRSKNKELIKSYLNRLNSGEDIELVREDFVKNFEYVDPSEIISAEQDLIIEKMPVEEVMKLCDVHSALFKGKTIEEQSMYDQIHGGQRKVSDIIDDLGHPITILIYENSYLKTQVIKIRELINNNNIKEVCDIFRSLSKISIHYTKKGDLLYPLLNVKYGFTGPATVMWGVDVEIRNEISDIIKNASINDDNYLNRVSSIISRVDEMIYKEQNILYPLILNTFSDEEFVKLYDDILNYDSLLPDNTYPEWENSKVILNNIENDNKDPLLNSISKESRIKLSKGHMTQEEITFMLNAIPLEITYIDKDDIIRYFNDEKEIKLFKRSEFILDMHLPAVHPPQAMKAVNAIIESLRSGKEDVVHSPAMKNGELVSIKYIAVRNDQGEFLGTMEIAQKLNEFKELFDNFFE